MQTYHVLIFSELSSAGTAVNHTGIGPPCVDPIEPPHPLSPPPETLLRHLFPWRSLVRSFGRHRTTIWEEEDQRKSSFNFLVRERRRRGGGGGGRPLTRSHYSSPSSDFLRKKSS